MAAAPVPAGAAMPPAALGGPAAMAPLLSFLDRFRDMRYDTEGDDYTRLLLQFDPMSAQSPTPAQLWSSVLQEPDDNSRAIAVHWQNPNQPADPGRIIVLHGIKQYPRALGSPPTQWDNISFAWYQDVVAGSAPTLLQIPAYNIFNVAEPTNGVINHRVYEAATLEAMYAADPQLIVAPLPGAGDAGTQVIQTRYSYPVPFRYVAGLLCLDTNPRNFFELIYPQIVAENRLVEMAPFIRWMCTTCTARHDQGPGQLISSAAQRAYRPPMADMDLRSHRQRLLHAKLPHLALPVAPIDTGLAQVGGQLISEIRQTREEARDRADAVTSPEKYYGALLSKHMRLAQVATENDLTPVHHAVAKQNSQKKSRHTQQMYLELLCETQGRGQLRLPITPVLSERLYTAGWFNYDLDDLSAGISTFMLGGCSQAEVKSAEQLISAYDMVAQSSGANFQDLQMALSTKNVSIPPNHTMAKIDLQRLEMLMRLYWGENAAVEAVVQFQSDYDAHLHLLIEYVPLAPGHAALVPGLVLRHFAAYLNYWVHLQLGSDSVVPFPAGVHDVWKSLVLKDPSWEKPFPKNYITSWEPPAPARVPSNSAGAGRVTPATAPPKRAQETHRNLYPNGNESSFLPYRRGMVGKKFKAIITAGVEAGHPIPTNAHGEEMCISFHILGNCNSFCSRKKDHNNLGGGANHTKAEDETLLKWCKDCIPTE